MLGESGMCFRAQSGGYSIMLWKAFQRLLDEIRKSVRLLIVQPVSDYFSNPFDCIGTVREVRSRLNIQHIA